LAPADLFAGNTGILLMISSFQVGQTHAMQAIIGAEDMIRYAELSGDFAPLHTDAAFAKAAGFSGVVVHGGYLIALVSRLVGMEFPGPKAVLERADMAFRRPCYAPCEVKLVATVKQISEAVESIILEIVISDAGGSILASGKTWHRMLSVAPRQ
jgi:3-hydroxybutyryl-CoA dehydratase